MANYTAGATFERAFMKWAEQTYDCAAFRMAGSHGKCDVILLPTFTITKRLPLDAPVAAQIKRTADKKKEEYADFVAWRPVGVNKWWVSKAKGVRFEDMKIEIL